MYRDTSHYNVSECSLFNSNLIPLRRETVVDVNLLAAATTFVKIGGGGCVIEQQLTSEMSRGLVGSRMSLRPNGFGLSKA